MHIVIFGPPGVGKGTQAKFIAEKLNIAHISTGDILRGAIGNKTELGLKAKEIVESGELVPDDLMGNIVKEALADENTKAGFILDGYPRTLNQAKILDGIFQDLNYEIPKVVSLEADDEVIVSRLSQRRTCSNCKQIVNLNLLENKTACPSCSAENTFVQRDDDNADVIKNRLVVYHETTKPVLDFYNSKTKVISIDGTMKIDDVKAEILNELGIR
jgi:adenylate kinase